MLVTRFKQEALEIVGGIGVLEAVQNEGAS
jgi:hypothetical protein